MRAHRCTNCGKVDEWGKTWRYWGTLLEDDPRWKACSKACADALMPQIEAEERLINGDEDEPHQVGLRLTGEAT